MRHANISGSKSAEPVPLRRQGPAGRYSEHRRSADFSAVLLFDAPFECIKREMVAEVSAEYPMLGVEEQSELNRQLMVGSGWSTMVRTNTAGHRHISRVASEAGPYEADFAYAMRHSYAFEDARKAVTTHASWVRVSTASEAFDSPARFRAATATTCISSVLARYPGCVGVYVPSANLLVSPQRWCRAADEAALGEFPIDAWIALAINRTEREGPAKSLASCSSIGLASFDGHEVHLPWSDMPPGDSARLVYSALWMLLVGGNRFSDGDMISDRQGTAQIRVRHAVEGKHGMQTDAWVLFDPSTVVSEEKLFETAQAYADPGSEPARPSGLTRLFSFIG